MNRKRQWMVFLILILNSSCATKRAHTAREIDELRALVNRAHDQALVKSGTPTIADEFVKKQSYEKFVTTYCQNRSREDCGSLYGKHLISSFESRYYAADFKVIHSRCSAGSISCMDPRIIEDWARESHNANIELSRAEKLPKLMLWRSGKLSNEELQSALHVTLTDK